MSTIDTSTPVLLLAGQENSLSIARNLGRLGIDVRISGRKGCWGMYSRFCKRAYRVPEDLDIQTYWYNLLIEPTHKLLEGHMVMACNDDALEFVVANRAALEPHYILEDCDPAIHKALLDKQRTIHLAESVDVPVPRYWPVDTLDDIDALEGEITLPVIVKPLNSLSFLRNMGAKLFIIRDSFVQLQKCAARAFENRQEIMIVEMIPGGDDKLCSYFTYITSDGHYLFDFTKSVVRRYPVGYGIGSCHVTRWQPDVMEMGRKFFDGVGFRGMGNIEFKRDGDELKIIEVNTRFAASHELITRSGAPIDLIVYCHLSGQNVPGFDRYEDNRYLWAPIADTLSFLHLRRLGQLTFRNWVEDLFAHKITFPILQWSDPIPALRAFVATVAKLKRLAPSRRNDGDANNHLLDGSARCDQRTPSATTRSSGLSS